MGQRRLQALGAWLIAVSVAQLSACADNAMHPVLGRDESPSDAPGTVVVSPAQARAFDTTVLGPGERVWIRQSRLSHSRFVCSDDGLLLCDRIGLRSYCQCNGPRKHH